MMMSWSGATIFYMTRTDWDAASVLVNCSSVVLYSCTIYRHVMGGKNVEDS